MKTLTDSLLLDRIHAAWGTTESGKGFTQIFQRVIGGKTIHNDNSIDKLYHQLWFIVIENPRYQITDNQLCQIMDEGNHCISKGSITYEENYAYIIWSNLGHI